MSLPVVQHFSVSAGDNAELSFIAPTGTVNLEGAAVTWSLYAQSLGVPSGDALVTKELDYGVEAENEGDDTAFTVELEQSDTESLLLGNYYHEAELVDGDGKNLTVVVGLLAVTGRSSSLTSRSLKLLYAELADYEDWVLELAIEQAVVSVGDSWIEADRVTARGLLAAHMVTAAALNSSGGSAGDITSESIGRISVSYANSSSQEKSVLLNQTSFGQQFLRYLRGSHGGPIVV